MHNDLGDYRPRTDDYGRDNLRRCLNSKKAVFTSYVHQNTAKIGIFSRLMKYSHDFFHDWQRMLLKDEILAMLTYSYFLNDRNIMSYNNTILLVYGVYQFFYYFRLLAVPLSLHLPHSNRNEFNITHRNSEGSTAGSAELPSMWQPFTRNRGANALP